MRNYKMENENEDVVVQEVDTDLYDTKYPHPDLYEYYNNLEERIIWIDSGISEIFLTRVINQIISFNLQDKNIPVEDRKPIKVLIYSFGGDGNVALGLIDAIACSKTPVYTFNMGVAMSAGLIILLAGHKRFCTKRSTALIHSGSGGASGTYEQTESAMKDYKHFIEVVREYILERTNIEPKTLKKKQASEWYIYSKEQFELGIVDKVIEDFDEILG